MPGVEEPGRTGACPTAWRTEFADRFEASFARLHRYLNRMSGDADLAADLAQETFVRLYRRGSLPEDADAWLFTVATNLFRNAATKRRNRARLLTPDRGLRAHSDPAALPDRTGPDGGVRARVRSALEAVSERERTLLLLAAEGLTYREVAAVLGVRESSVGTLLRRAKEAFRRAYGEDSDGA